MELKPGYKLTEVGIIPEDWDVKPLGSVLSKARLGGNYPNRDNEADFPLMKMGNIARGHFELAKVEFITPGVRPEPAHRLVRGDVLFNTRNTLDLVGKVAIWRDELPVAYYNSNLLRLEFDPQEICSHEYANLFLNTLGSMSRLRALATGTTSVAAIYTRDLLDLPVAIPSHREQRAIAAALSDMDALLDGLGRLMAKKRDLKQAAMQQLLTGQIRLPGFQGEWVPLEMAQKSTLNARIGWQGLTTSEYLSSGQHFLVTGTDFAGGRVTWSTCCFVSEARYAQDRKIQLRSNDILLTKDGTIGKVGFVDSLPGPATLNSGIFVIRPKNESYDPKFFYYVLTSSIFDDFIKKLQAGSTISHLYQKDFVSFSFLAPPTVAEQTAIATVLSDIDAELSELEARHDKTCSLKEAMMQELLTGTTRLVARPGESKIVAFPQSILTRLGPKESTHNWAFNEAVVISVLTDEFGSSNFPLGRKRYTKLAYLLHRHAEHEAKGYLKKAAGPYNPATRYAGPEKIAQENSYVRRHSAGKFSGFVAGSGIGQAKRYFNKWYGLEVLGWLEQFRFKSNADLELLATVDMALVDLKASGLGRSLDTVKSVIRGHPDWEAKLDRPVFSDERIATAIEECQRLFST